MREKLIELLGNVPDTQSGQEICPSFDYRRRKIQTILNLSDPYFFEAEARRYIEYERVLELSNAEINNLPAHWNKDLWRDAALIFGDGIFDLIHKAKKINSEFNALYNHPPVPEFYQAIKDKAFQFISNIPTFSHSDAQSIPRFLELASEAVRALHSLPEVVQALNNLPPSWNRTPWQARAALYGGEVREDLDKSVDLVEALEQIKMTVSSWDVATRNTITDRIQAVINGIRSPDDAIDTKLATKSAKQIAKNFTWALTILNQRDAIDERFFDIALLRSFRMGLSAFHDLNDHHEMGRLDRNVEITREFACADVDLRERHLDDAQYERLKAFAKRSFAEHGGYHMPSMAHDFARAVMVGFPIIRDPYILPDHSTVGVEIELFGVLPSSYPLLDDMIEILEPGTARTLDTSIRPTDNTEGLEIVSPVLRGNFESTIGIVETLHQLGGRADLPCALHAHHGIVKNYGELQLDVTKQLKLLYIAAEDDLEFIDSALTHYYKRVFADNGKSLADVQRDILRSGDYFDLMRVTQPAGRRRARLNLHSIFEHGTVEFRQHPGTVDPAKVAAWIKFTASMVDMAHRIVIENGQAILPQDQHISELKQMVASLKAERVTRVPWQYHLCPQLVTLN